MLFFFSKKKISEEQDNLYVGSETSTKKLENYCAIEWHLPCYMELSMGSVFYSIAGGKIFRVWPKDL